MNGKSIISIIFIAAIITAGGLTVMSMNAPDSTEYSIEYELNGDATNPESNPESYVSGKEYKLYDAISNEKKLFTGWYLNAELTEKCSSITGNFKGDIVLYAGWTDSVIGMGYRLDVIGYADSILEKYVMSGYAEYYYLSFDSASGKYFIQNETKTIYDYGTKIVETEETRNYWSGEEETVWEYVGTEIIGTIAGDKNCEIWRCGDSEKGIETQWIGDGWIPYKVEYVLSGPYANVAMTYTFSKQTYMDMEKPFDVIIYADKGITVSGGGNHLPGESVTVSVSDSGSEFAGWYKKDGTMLSKNKTYTFTMGANDFEICALNNQDPDETAKSGISTKLNVFSNDIIGNWTITDMNDKTVVYKTYGSSPEFIFAEGGKYTISIAGTINGTEYYGFYTLLISGDVSNTFTWKYDGMEYSYTLVMEYTDVDYYQNLYGVDERRNDSDNNYARNKSFVTYSDKYIVKLAEDLWSMCPGTSDTERLNFVLSFVQYMEYRTDPDGKNVDEYWKFPLETLFDGNGDCEDTTILYCAILKAKGYSVAMFLIPGHMAAGVVCGEIKGTAFEKDGLFYLYSETTTSGYVVGVLPSGIGESFVTVIPVN